MKYLRKIVYESVWNGDNVRVEMEPIDRGSFIRLWSAQSDVSVSGVDRYRVVMEVLDQHVTSITGLVDAAGTPIAKEIILSKMFFSDLVNEMSKALMEGGMLEKAPSGVSVEKSLAGAEARS